MFIQYSSTRILQYCRGSRFFTVGDWERDNLQEALFRAIFCNFWCKNVIKQKIRKVRLIVRKGSLPIYTLHYSTLQYIALFQQQQNAIPNQSFELQLRCRKNDSIRKHLCICLIFSLQVQWSMIYLLLKKIGSPYWLYIHTLRERFYYIICILYKNIFSCQPAVWILHYIHNAERL